MEEVIQESGGCGVINEDERFLAVLDEISERQLHCDDSRSKHFTGAIPVCKPKPSRLPTLDDYDNSFSDDRLPMWAIRTEDA